MVLPGGCGLVGLVGSETPSEKKVAAEFAPAGFKDKKILVYVEQPGWLNAGVNLRYHLTDLIIATFVDKVKLRHEQFISYDELSGELAGRPGLRTMTAVEIGRELKADMVLLVSIDEFELDRVEVTNYYKGYLGAICSLSDVSSGRKLWPESDDGRSIRAGFEAASGGQTAAVARLAGAIAYCTVRYFYDCSSGKFKIGDERSSSEWKTWR
jgi:hypothetical protein